MTDSSKLFIHSTIEPSVQPTNQLQFNDDLLWHAIIFVIQLIALRDMKVIKFDAQLMMDLFYNDNVDTVLNYKRISACPD